METIEALHKKNTNKEAAHTFFVPGCVALLGEYTEEQGGPALMVATEQGILGAISGAKDQSIKIYFDALENNEVLIDIKNPLALESPYLVRLMQATFLKLQKEDCAFKEGLEITLSSTLKPLFNYHLDSAMVALIMTLVTKQLNKHVAFDKICKFSDAVFTDYLQLPTRHNALTTQFFAEKDTVLAIHPYEKKHQTIPFQFKDKTLVVFAPHKTHDEMHATYKDRLKNLKAASEFYMNHRPIKYLAAVSVEDFNKFKHQLTPENRVRYAEHIIFETARYKDVVEMIEDNEFNWFADYINESQKTVEHMFDYVTTDLKYIIDMLKTDAVRAARISNKTFSQLVVGYFEKESNKFIEDIQLRYQRMYKKELETIILRPSAGAIKK